MANGKRFITYIKPTPKPVGPDQIGDGIILKRDAEAGEFALVESTLETAGWTGSETVPHPGSVSNTGKKKLSKPRIRDIRI